MAAPIFAALSFSADDDPYDDGLGYQEKLQQLSDNFLLLSNYIETIEAEVLVGSTGYNPQGVWDASGNVYPAGVDNGSWIVSVAGTLGGDEMKPGSFFVYSNGVFINRKLISGNIVEDTTPQLGGVLDPQDNAINEGFALVTSTGNVTTIDCSKGNHFGHLLTENTVLEFINVPASGTSYSLALDVYQDVAASGFTFTFPVSAKIPEGAITALTATASAEDSFVLRTRDGGASWRLFVGGKDLK